MGRFIVHREALVDLEDISTYVHLHSPRAAHRLVQDIKASYQLIARHPTIGWPSEPHGPDIRGLTVGSYVVYYRVGGSEVTILRIVHGARNRWSMRL